MELFSFLFLFKHNAIIEINNDMDGKHKQILEKLLSIYNGWPIKNEGVSILRISLWYCGLYTCIFFQKIGRTIL